MNKTLVTSLITGVFCAIFAVGVSYLALMLTTPQVAIVGFVSGSLGSFFGQKITGRK